jgi:hypothetical protein
MLFIIQIRKVKPSKRVSDPKISSIHILTFENPFKTIACNTLLYIGINRWREKTFIHFET